MSKRPEYKFSKEVQDKLKGFRTYLKRLRNGEDTIRQKLNYAGYFLKWLESENLQAEGTRYNDLLNFIDYCKLEGRTNRHINRKLGSIRNYYDYLKKKHPEIINPASNLFLKGVIQKIPSNIIEFTELEQLYQSFEALTIRDKRNKVMLGLLIYQGLATGELRRLEPGHIKLKEGKIYVPGNRESNSRKLELKPFQILELHEFLSETRQEILDGISKPKPARKPDKINKKRIKDQLFISMNGSENIKNSLLHMFRAIQKEKPEILHAKQIRASVITYWLKNHNLRQVQYMAGHKRIGSTERYKLNNLENLQSQLEKLHPLNN